MQDRPSADDILEIIATFLREKAIPALPPRLGFEARIAATGLDLIRREIELGQLGEAAELERLREILGRDGLLEELNAALAKGLRSGEIDAKEPKVTEHLRQTAIEKMQVDQPRYSALVAALNQQSAKDGKDGI